MTKAADAFICEAREVEVISPQMAASFLSLCRKSRFKNDLVVNTVTTLMLPLIKRLQANESSHEVQKAQDVKAFAEFVTSLAGLNVDLDDLKLETTFNFDPRDHTEVVDLKQLIADCVTQHASELLEQIAFFKSVAILGLLNNAVFRTISDTLSALLVPGTIENDTLVEFQQFCAQLILAEGFLSKLPSALVLAESIQDDIETLADLKRSKVVLSDADVHVRQFFEEAAIKLDLEFMPSDHVGLGYVADSILLPEDLWNKVGAKRIVADCPSLSDSVNMFESLRGEKLVQIKHLKQLNSILFIVDPLHWEQLESSQEKLQYLEAKFAIELEHLLKPHFDSFDFNEIE